MDSAPRYLVPFHPKRVPHHFADVLIIGGGLAGLRAALAVDPSLSVLVITKDSLQQSNSAYAQGGIAGVLDPEDRFEDHIADTLTRRRRPVRSGGGRDGRPRGARPDRRTDRLGNAFRRRTPAPGPGPRRRAQPPPHRPRLGRRHRQGSDAGRDRADAQLAERRNLASTPSRSTCSRTKALAAARWSGTPQHGKTLVWAKQTILCTGGRGQVYRETTNPDVATGDGLAMAYRAGAELRDMEFMQFHPTVLYIAGSSRNLITEAMRGEGAHLVDRNGHRFMPDYDPRAELAPRDVVSRAIVTQMEKTRHPNVYLDLSHLDPQRRAAAISGHRGDLRRVRHWTSPAIWIPVRPGAHYMIGGVTRRHGGPDHAARPVGGRRSHLQRPARGQSAGLEQPAGGAGLRRACRRGGCAQAAAHGRRFSGRAAGQSAGGRRRRAAGPGRHPQFAQEPDVAIGRRAPRWAGHLAEAAENIDRWCRYVLPRQFTDPEGWELQNMLTDVAADDRRGPGAGGNPRRPRADRFSQYRRCPLAAALGVSAGK